MLVAIESFTPYRLALLACCRVMLGLFCSSARLEDSYSIPPTEVAFYIFMLVSSCDFRSACAFRAVTLDAESRGSCYDCCDKNDGHLLLWVLFSTCSWNLVLGFAATFSFFDEADSCTARAAIEQRTAPELQWLRQNVFPKYQGHAVERNPRIQRRCTSPSPTVRAAKAEQQGQSSEHSCCSEGIKSEASHDRLCAREAGSETSGICNHQVLCIQSAFCSGIMYDAVRLGPALRNTATLCR